METHQDSNDGVVVWVARIIRVPLYDVEEILDEGVTDRYCVLVSLSAGTRSDQHT